MNYTQPRLVYTPEELAYAAGLLDAEGSICIAVKRVKDHLPTYYLIVSIANTHQPTIEWLHETFTCGTLNNPKPKSPQHKPIWIWQVQCNPAGLFLQMISPYLVVKREQAKAALAFHGYHQRTSHYGTEETAKRKEEYRQQIKKLNTCSRDVATPPLLVASTADIAHLAAFFDGEGSVKVTMRESRRTRRGKGFPMYGLQVNIGNSDYPILLQYQTLFSGNLAPMSSLSSIKPMWRWHLLGDAAQQFLQAVLPYLKIKREHAVLGIEFQDYHRAHWQAIHAQCTPEVLARKEGYRQRISKLALYGETIKPLPERFTM